jgi:methyl-accepting chemotaxis protein
MSLKEEIKKAIGAHGMWKARLSAAIDSGSSDAKPETVSVDNLCDFGKWLYGDSIDNAVKKSDHYQKCRDLHAIFHREAGNVLRLALQGQKEKAQQAMSYNGSFGSASAELTRAMINWERSLSG